MTIRFTLALLAATAAPALLHAQIIGNVAAANEDIVGTPPAADPRLLGLGIEVFADERVETSSVGSGQFLFLDQTSLTVWPDSEVVLDSYVYDPERDVGEMAISMGRGVLRFIGGRISKNTDVTITTPHAVVAVRGGISQIEVTGDLTSALHAAGDFTRITPLSGGSPVTLARPNALGTASAGGGAQFVGIANAETVRESWGRQPGEGDGGAPEPVTPANTDPLIDTNIAALGSGDPQAASAAPVSTTGEREPTLTPEEEIQEASEQVTEDAQESVIDDAVDDTVDEIIDEDEVPNDDDFVLPVGATELVGFTGIRNRTEDGVSVERFGQEIDDAASRNFAIGNPDQREDFVLFYTVPDDGADTGRRVEAKTESGGNVFLLEDPGISFESGDALNPNRGPKFGGRPVDLARFIVPDTLYVATFESIDDDPKALVLDIFGSPTPTEFFRQESTNDIDLLVYDVSSNLLTARHSDSGTEFLGDPVPEALLDANGGDFFDDVDAPLVFVPEPNAPLLRAPGEVERSKWLLPVISIEGQGSEQISAHGVMTRRVLATSARHPAIDGFLPLTLSLDAAQPPSFSFINLGTPITSDGAAIYGDNAEYIVLSDINVLDSVDNEFESRASDFSQWAYDPADERFETFGGTRVAVLEEISAVPAAERIRAAIPISESWLSDSAFNPPGASQDGRGIPSSQIEYVFDGGYASTAAFSQLTEPQRRVNTPYLLRTNTPDDVRFGFGTSQNAFVGEFGDFVLDSPGQPETDGFVLAAGTRTEPGEVAPALSVNWGNTLSGDAFLTDEEFFARSSFELEGYLTGQEPSLFGKLGRPTEVNNVGEIEQNSWQGSISSAYTDTAALTSAIANGEPGAPEYLRWGWWSGEYRFDEEDSDPDFTNRRDRMHLGVWVAGVQSDIAQLPQSGEAIYNGFAVANVLETPQGADVPFSYVDDGNVIMSYDFGVRRGEIVVEGIADTTISAVIRETTATAGFPGAGAYPRTNHYAADFLVGSNIVTGTPGEVNQVDGSIQGAFFKGGADPSAATAGAFDFDGTRFTVDGTAIVPDARIQASGVYAAEKVSIPNSNSR